MDQPAALTHDAPQSGSLGHILVVDDIEDNRNLLERRLTRQGFAVTVVDSGRNALKAIAENDLDLVLLDIMMPAMSGLETLERLRRTSARESLPVIMVTAKSESEDVVEALEMGANDYITKPIDFPVALARIETHLALKRADTALRSSEARSAFLATMSHELLTPLNAINGFSELMTTESHGPLGSIEYQNYAGFIKDAGEQLVVLINDILDISKIASGNLALSEDTIDVAALVRSCIAMVREPAGTGDVKIIVDIDEDILPHLRADGMRSKQIVLNLLSNAVKFTPPEGTITVRAWFHMDNGFVLQVADTGIGIAVEDMPKALTPFEQIESSLDRAYEGIGLGLPLTKSLVKHHGGTLDLQSQVGIGTVVTINLPASRAILSAV